MDTKLVQPDIIGSERTINREKEFHARTKLLIAVGAAITVNCQPSFATAIKEAQRAGAEEKNISEAIAIGRVVRKGAIGKMDKFVSTFVGKSFNDGSDDYPFASTEEEVKSWVDQNDQCGCK